VSFLLSIDKCMGEVRWVGEGVRPADMGSPSQVETHVKFYINKS